MTLEEKDVENMVRERA